MCAMNRACWAAGTVASPGGTRDAPTSRITMVRTASSPGAPVRSIATTVWSMRSGAWSMIPDCQIRYGAVHVIVGDPHDPVRGSAESLDEERLRTDRDPLEYRPGPRVGGFHSIPGRRPGQQLPG